MKKDINKYKKAFTLVEILVSIAIFSLLIAGPTGFFISSIKGQKKALSSQELIDNASYFLEYFSRAVRMAQKAKDTGCLSFSNLNYELIAGPGIKFVNYKGECQEIFLFLDEQTKTYRIKEIRKALDGIPKEGFLTASNLEVSSFQVKLSGETQGDNLQPKVTVLLKMKGTSQSEEMNPEISIQTTLSQRNLDIEE